MAEKIFSKVILSGEHSVLRGGFAVVAPNKNYYLEYTLDYNDSFVLNLSDEVKPYELLFLGLVESALKLSNSTREDLKVKADVTTIVPLGEGLGGSAALCVFVARVFLFSGILKESEVFPFAHEIENVFHGQSSGLDVAGCMFNQISLYQKGVKKIQSLVPKLKDYAFTIHQSGEKGETKECIEKVLKLRESNKDLFNSLDDRMSNASLLIKKGIENGEIELVLKSFDETTQIYKNWGLLTNQVIETMEKLMNQGALAVRSTGSGDGGCVLALWRNKELPSHYANVSFLSFE